MTEKTDFEQLLEKLNAMPVFYHSDVIIEDATQDEIKQLFKHLRSLGFVPKWIGDNEIRVTNCKGKSKIFKDLAALSPVDIKKIHQVMIAGGISAYTHTSYAAFRAVFKTEQGKAKKRNDAMWKFYRMFAESTDYQISGIINFFDTGEIKC